MEKIPFSKEELKVVGSFPAAKHPGGKIKLNTPITAKENYRALLHHEPLCWLPDNDYILFNPSIIPDNVARAFVREQNPPEQKGGADMFGIDWVYVPTVDGSMVRPGNPVLTDVNNWKEVIRFPETDAWDWAGSALRNRAYLGSGDDPVWLVQLSGLFERLISFMDFEGAAMAMIDEDQEEALHQLFSALCDLYIKIIDKAAEHFHITGYTFHDDWGSQMAPFFSKRTFRAMIAPYIRILVDHCHKKGILFELHSCGHSESMADAICENGIDMWRPQPMNDIDKLYHDWGDKITFGINPPVFPPHASDEDQVAAAQALVRRFSEPGKYVYTASAADTPVYRAALYEASRKAYLNT